MYSQTHRSAQSTPAQLQVTVIGTSYGALSLTLTLTSLWLNATTYNINGSPSFMRATLNDLSKALLKMLAKRLVFSWTPCLYIYYYVPSAAIALAVLLVPLFKSTVHAGSRVIIIIFITYTVNGNHTNTQHTLLKLNWNVSHLLQ